MEREEVQGTSLKALVQRDGTIQQSIEKESEERDTFYVEKGQM